MDVVKQLPSRLDALPVFISEVLGLVQAQIPLNNDQIFDIKLVLEEALTNAVRHGNKHQEDLLVSVKVGLQGRVLTIEIRNQGQGFDPNQVPDPTLPSGLTKTSGRGVFLMRKIMDKVEYTDCGRCLTMSKLL